MITYDQKKDHFKYFDLTTVQIACAFLTSEVLYFHDYEIWAIVTNFKFIANRYQPFFFFFRLESIMGHVAH